MKRMLVLLIFALALAMPALAEQPFSPYDHITGRSGGGRYLYYDFPDISLNLPIEWDGHITVEQTDTGVFFYQTASLEKYQEEGVPGGGFLFALCASADEGFRELPAFEYLGYSPNAGLHFYLQLPSDDPAYPGDAMRREYDAMAGDIPGVVQMARIAPSLRYYTEGVESTDPGMS